MTFAQAQKKLLKIAGERYCTIAYELTVHGKYTDEADREIESLCTVYIAGNRHHTGATWEDAFRSLERNLSPVVEAGAPRGKP